MLELNENENRISWEELYFKIAKVVSERSEDPKTKVGAVLVKDGCVVGIGYNGSARKSTLEFDWHSEEKYNYVIHAELNAIANACRMGISCNDTDIYITHSPCHNCLNILIQHGIKNIYFKEIYHKEYELTMKIANHANINLIKIN